MKQLFYNQIDNLLKEYTGGESFFFQLDKVIKFNNEALTFLLKEAKLSFPNCFLIASGEIGLCLHNLSLPIDILVKGGLRFNQDIDLSYLDLKNKDFLFIDDSFFSGKTYETIKNEVIRHGGNMVGAFVVYDGSKEKREDVHSFYRYYDYH